MDVLVRVGAMGVKAVNSAIAVAMLLTGFSVVVTANESTPSKKIYTCTDAKGRRLSSDRPIPECLDREQRELSGSGFTRRVIPPAQSDADRAREAAEQAAQKQQQEEEKERIKEAERRTQLMLIRYPNQAKHDDERRAQLETVQATVTTIEIRQRELEREAQTLKNELEFYKGDVNSAPKPLQRRVKSNEEQINAQRQALLHQEQERKRIHARFDEELIELKKLWQTQPTANAPTKR